MARTTRAAPALVALLATGCGGAGQLGTAGIARSIARSIVEQRHILATVECPPRVPREKGRRFTCVARLDVGRYPIAVRVVDDAGNVRWSSTAPLVALDVRRVESAIERAILAQRRLHATARCPATVLQKAGLRFTCRATVDGRVTSFAVRQTDARGHVRFLGL